MQGDDRADYEWLFRATYPRVHRMVTLVVHDAGRAEEITQDAFLKLLENWRKVSGFEQPEAWVRRVAIRMAVRQAVRESRRAQREQWSRTPSPEPERDLDLIAAVRSLAPRQRAAVVLHYYNDLPVVEVARVLDVSESSVKQHLFRARTRLAELLGEEVDRADR